MVGITGKLPPERGLRVLKKYKKTSLQKAPDFTYIYIYIYVFTWLLQVLVAACRIFSCCMRTLSCGTWDLVP